MSTGKHLLLDLIRQGQLDEVRTLLLKEPNLAGSNFDPASLHCEGFPLVVAVRSGQLEMIRLLLDFGANPNADLKVEDPREFGMPLMIAFEQRDFSAVHLLLDHGASLFAHPYCATPFPDAVLNACGDYTSFSKFRAGTKKFETTVVRLIERSYRTYLAPYQVPEPLSHSSVADLPDVIRLFERVVEQGGYPSFFTLARHEQLDLIRRLLEHSAGRPGTKLDWPQGNVFSNIRYGASWTGIPSVLEVCKQTCSERYSDETSRYCIERAIRSHNRDGTNDDYRQLIENELKFLQNRQAIQNDFDDGRAFAPLLWLATDFIEPSHYGFRCEELLTEEDAIEMVRLFLRYGFDPEKPHPESGQTPADAAESNGWLKLANELRKPVDTRDQTETN